MHPTTEGKEYYRNTNKDLINKIHKEYLKPFESKEFSAQKKQEPSEIKKESEKQKPKKKNILETIFGSIGKR